MKWVGLDQCGVAVRWVGLDRCGAAVRWVGLQYHLQWSSLYSKWFVHQIPLCTVLPFAPMSLSLYMHQSLTAWYITFESAAYGATESDHDNYINACAPITV